MARDRVNIEKAELGQELRSGMICNRIIIKRIA